MRTHRLQSQKHARLASYQWQHPCFSVLRAGQPNFGSSPGEAQTAQRRALIVGSRGKVYGFTSAYLGEPDVKRAGPVGQKRDELAVWRDGGIQLFSSRIRQASEGRIFKRIFRRR